MSSDAVTVFFSYSHKDELLRDELANHLESLKYSGDITDWHDRQILPGDEWDREIKDNLNRANIILLLISSDFISSSYCRDIEIERAVERHEAGDAWVIPIILRHCLWSSMPFGKLQALPKNAAPVTDTKVWGSKDQAFTDVAEGIQKTAHQVRQKLKAIQQDKLNQYETAYQSAIQQAYPLGEAVQGQLNRLQRALDLADAEIAAIVTRLSAQYGEARQKLDQYRDEVRLCLQEDGGEISAFSRTLLAGFCSTFGLTAEEAAAVEQEELAPYRAKAEAIGQYTQVFADAVNQETPLSAGMRSRLQRFQRTLELSENEVQGIETPLLQASENKRLDQEQADYANNLRHYEQEFIRSVENRYPLSQRVLELLQTLQRHLNLKDADVASVEEPIRAAAEEKYQRQWKEQESAEAERKRQAAIAAAGQQRQRELAEAERQTQAELAAARQRQAEAEAELAQQLAATQSLKPTDNKPVSEKSFTEALGNGIGLEMVAIPAGEFMMGSPEGEGASDERPQHQVSVPGFWMGKFPVTQSQYQAVMGKNPSRFTENGEKRPVERVSWHDAVAFCERLSQHAGRMYRLPSEAEWEYACRAGTTTRYAFGDGLTAQQANFGNRKRIISEGILGIGRKEVSIGTEPVGRYPANGFGLHDLHGNVWEWCQDLWHGSYLGAPVDGCAWEVGDSNSRVTRGGSWNNAPRYCRSAYRGGSYAVNRNNGIGFRVCCSAPRAS